jgi:hypothetical protein
MSKKNDKASAVLTKKQLKIAGWLSIVLSIITIPGLIIEIIVTMANHPSKGFHPLSAISDIISTLLYVYLFLVLKKLLDQKLNSHQADKVITWLIVLEVVSVIVSELLTFIQPLAFVFFLLFIPMGILLISLGLQLLKVQDKDFQLFRPFSYQLITAGVSLASIVLFPLAIIFDIIFHVTLGIIFLQNANTLSAD